MSNKYRFSDSEDEDSDSDDEEFINQFKMQALGQKSNQTISSQQNEETKTDTENSLNGFMFKSKLQEQSNQSQMLSRENSNHSLLNSSQNNSQSLNIPAKKIKKNIRQIQSDDSDEEDQTIHKSIKIKQQKNVEALQSSNGNSRSQQQQSKGLMSMSLSGGTQLNRIGNKETSIIREIPFPLLEIPSSNEDLVISTRKYKEIEVMFNDLSRGGMRNIIILYGSSGVGKKTLVSYLVEKKLKWSILHLHRMKKLQQSADNEQQNEEDSRVMTNSSQLENPVDLLLYAFNRSLSANLYRNEVIVMQELPENITQFEQRRITEFINKRYIKTRTKKNPIVFILNTSIYSNYLVNKIFKDSSPEFFSQCVNEVNLPRPSDKEIQSFVQKQMNNNVKFQSISGYQRNTIMQDIMMTANGDISNVLNQLKMISFSRLPSTVSIKNKKKVQQPSTSKDVTQNSEKQKDNEFTIFHSLGKFLYNKRKFIGSSEEPKQMTKEELLSGKTEFYFDPMKMIQQINCNQQFFRNTLQQNYLDFYANIEDVVGQTNNFILCDIFDRQNFNEKNEIIKEENDYLSSFIAGEGVMLNNLNGKDVKKKYVSITKSQLGEVNNEKKIRQQNLKRSFPHLTLSKYVLEYNHHLSLNPAILAQDLMKQKGKWNQTQQLEENTNNINSIGFDAIGEEGSEQSFTRETTASSRNMVLFRKEIVPREIIEDDIEEC